MGATEGGIVGTTASRKQFQSPNRQIEKGNPVSLAGSAGYLPDTSTKGARKKKRTTREERVGKKEWVFSKNPKIHVRFV